MILKFDESLKKTLLSIALNYGFSWI